MKHFKIHLLIQKMNRLNSKGLSKRYSLSIQNQIIPNIISNKFIYESSTIVNEIIEKIISLVISTDFNNKVEKNIFILL